MLDRTRDIEDRMARSERETRQLQRRLEEARRSAEVALFRAKRAGKNRVEQAGSRSASDAKPVRIASTA
ncbi:hypothetical protein [Novosphingobium aquae]|uniref:Uncharacterized protein n=1 Tax=Novosphingobium aquae TaxID=3133435 RepID=A0ABU8S637_9SPHN